MDIYGPSMWTYKRKDVLRERLSHSLLPGLLSVASTKAPPHNSHFPSFESLLRTLAVAQSTWSASVQLERKRCVGYSLFTLGSVLSDLAFKSPHVSLLGLFDALGFLLLQDHNADHISNVAATTPPTQVPPSPVSNLSWIVRTFWQSAFTRLAHEVRLPYLVKDSATSQISSFGTLAFATHSTINELVHICVGRELPYTYTSEAPAPSPASKLKLEVFKVGAWLAGTLTPLLRSPTATTEYLFPSAPYPALLNVRLNEPKV